MTNEAPQIPKTDAPRIREIGPFEILVKIGQGGMGTVFKARQKSLEREVALKVLPPSAAKDAQFISRFQKEARASARLNHPNIVTGIDVGQDPKTGLWYFAMEYIDGPSLKDVLTKRQVLPEAEVLKIAIDMAKALDCLQANAMIHRDIKPDNIMMTQRGDAKLADLGLAKDIQEDASLTQAGKAVGTPHYMAPEQVRGETTNLDIRTDIYALGGTLYHLVTGKTPYQGETSAVIMAKHLTDPAPKATQTNPAVSIACSRLIEKMMAKKKEDRPQSAKDLLALLEKVQRGEFTTTGPRAPIKGGTGKHVEVGRNSGSALPIAAAAVVALCVAAFALFGMGGKPTEPTGNGVANTNVTPPNVPKPPEAAPTPPVANNTPPVEAPKPPEAPTEDARAKLDKELADVQAYEKEHPNAFGAIVKRYSKLADEAQKVPGAEAVEEKVGELVTAVKERHAAAAAEAWSKLETATQAALAEGKYDAALAAIEETPKNVAGMLAEKIRPLQREIHREAEEKSAAIVAKLELSSKDAEPDAGLKLLPDLEKIDYAPARSLAVQWKTRLEQEAANVAELRKKREEQALEKAFSDVLDRFDKAVLEARDVKLAQDIVRVAQSNTMLKKDPARLQALADLAGVLDAPAQHETKCLLKQGNTPLSVELNSGAKYTGTVKKVENGMVYMAVTLDGLVGVGQKTFKLSDISDATRRKYIPEYAPDSPAQKLVLALEHLAPGREDYTKAGEWLAAAADFPLSARYQAKVDQTKAAQAKQIKDRAAKQLWAEILTKSMLSKPTPADTKQLTDAIAKFDAEYADTDIHTVEAAKLAQIKEKLNSTTAVNLVQNGDFEKPALEHWSNAIREGIRVAPAAEAARSGKQGLQFIGTRRASLYQPLQLEAGTSYKAIAWVRLVRGVPGRLDTQIGIDDGDDPTRSPAVTLEMNTWTKVEVVFTARREQERLELFTRYRNDSPATVQWDDVTVLKQEQGVGLASPLPAAEVPAPLKNATLRFWVAPQVCAGGTTRELCNNLVATVTGRPSVTQDAIKAVQFGGAGSLTYTMPKVFAPETAQNGSAFASIKLSATGQTMGIVTRGTQEVDDISLMVVDGKLIAHFDGDGTGTGKGYFVSKQSLPADKWVHVGATWDGRAVSLYINGAKDSAHPSPVVAPARTSVVTIGDNPTGKSEFYRGLIGNVMFFEKPLNDGEIILLYSLFSGILGK